RVPVPQVSACPCPPSVIVFLSCLLSVFALHVCIWLSSPISWLQPVRGPVWGVIRSSDASYVTPQTCPQMILRVQTAEDNTTLRTSRANMSPTVFILLSLLLGVSHALLKVHVEPNVVAAPGATVQLKCLLQEVKDPLDLKDLMILWFTRGIQVAEFDKTITIDKPGMSMSLEALKKGDATLTIQSFSPEHAGNYRCHVFYKSENTMRQTVLSSNGE
ncbi:hypothetical protein GDO81_028266, partial [Engystomops pustulosus]